MSHQSSPNLARFLRRAAWIASATLLAATSAMAADPASMVPVKYKTAPVIMGTTATMAPVESVDPATGQIVGIEPELARAVARKLNVKLEIQNVAWDGLLASMQSGRFDIAASGITDTLLRQQAMDFVDWYQSGSTLMVLKGNPKKVSGPASFCGLTLGAARATTFFKALEAAAAQCTGKPTPVIATESTPAGVLMLKSGRVDLLSVDALAALTYLKANPDMELATTEQDNVAVRGVAFAKTNTALRDAWQAGLKVVIDSGEYDEILKRFEASVVAYRKATVNGGSQ